MQYPNSHRRPPQCRATLNCDAHVDRAIDPPAPEMPTGSAPTRVIGRGAATFAEALPVIFVVVPGRPVAVAG